mmetsp:Transcript_55563/g.82598  ORF Transcript_55563/g.82598 Transcript_55563/m.82598 type:complete len:98 (+) Transcript_55563:1142-1435(+)
MKLLCTHNWRRKSLVSSSIRPPKSPRKRSPSFMEARLRCFWRESERKGNYILLYHVYLTYCMLIISIHLKIKSPKPSRSSSFQRQTSTILAHCSIYA